MGPISFLVPRIVDAFCRWAAISAVATLATEVDCVSHCVLALVRPVAPIAGSIRTVAVMITRKGYLESCKCNHQSDQRKLGHFLLAILINRLFVAIACRNSSRRWYSFFFALLAMLRLFWAAFYPSLVEWVWRRIGFFFYCSDLIQSTLTCFVCLMIIDKNAKIEF